MKIILSFSTVMLMCFLALSPITVLAENFNNKTNNQILTLVVKPNNTIIVEPSNTTKLENIIQTSHEYDITIGVVLGVIVTFSGYALTELVKVKKFRSKIRTLIRIELRRSYVDFLRELRDNFTRGNSIFVPSGNSMIIRIKQILPENGKFKPSYYMSLSPETKSSAFNSDELTRIEELYARIHYFRAQAVAFTPTEMFSGFTFSLEEINNLISDIENMANCLD